MDIVAGLASLDAALKIAKGLRDVEKAYDQVTLKGQVVDLMGALYDVKGQLLEAKEAVTERDAEIERLNKALTAQEALLDGPGGYKWIDHGQGLRLGYPVCPSCFVGSGRQVELKQDGGAYSTKCPLCSSTFTPVECFLPADANGKQQTVRQQLDDARALQNARNNAELRRLGHEFG